MDLGFIRSCWTLRKWKVASVSSCPGCLASPNSDSFDPDPAAKFCMNSDSSGGFRSFVSSTMSRESSFDFVPASLVWLQSSSASLLSLSLSPERRIS